VQRIGSTENQGVTVEASQHEHEREITLIIIYGVNKHLKVERTETIEKVKLGAMGLFSIPESDHGSFVLKTKIDGHEEQLDEAKTVEHYHLHEDQKVTLAAGTPFGDR
jgi:intein/homing endonuclease